MTNTATTRAVTYRRHAAALGITLLAILAPASVQADAGADLPMGPKENLTIWAGDDFGALADLLGKSLSVEQWRQELTGIDDDSAVSALADYLGLYAPISNTAGTDVASLVAELPADGKELFVLNCLACHGGDKYFLQQTKDVDEWMGIFDAPYHRRLLTEGTEREAFAGYASATAPLVLDPVPESLGDKAD